MASLFSINIEQGSCMALSLLNFFASTIVSKVSNEYNFSETDIRQNATFDFIIVGAGTTGCALANRLSENPNRRVLLLEAGCDHILFENTPDSLVLTAIDQKCIWSDATVSRAGVGLGIPVSLPSANTLGGSSSIGEALYTRGNKKDYDDWEARGNPGWDYKSVLPYFKKAEYD